MSVSIHWFQRDLRLRDNAALAAARAGTERTFGVFALADLDGLSPRQHSFAVGCLKQLRIQLERHDASLTLVGGPIATALPEAASRLGATTVHAARTYSGAELRLQETAEAALAAHGIALRL